MDANGTRFHLLLGRGDWGGRCRTDKRPLEAEFVTSENGGEAGFSWDGKRHELTLGVRVPSFPPSAANRAVRPDERRGAAMDRFENVYWISEDRAEILVLSAATGETTHFWASLDACRRASKPTDFGSFRALPALPADAAPRPIPLAGLAVTTQHYLVAGTIDPPGLLVFDLQTGGEPRHLLWPAAVPFVPFDLSAASDGGVFVLDQKNLLVWRLDRTFAVVSRHAAALPAPEDFVAIDGSASQPAVRPGALTSDLAIPVLDPHPVAVAALPDGSLLVLHSPPGARFSTVARYKDGLPAGPGVSTDAAHDFAYLEHRAGTEEPLDDVLYIVGNQGDQAFAFELTRQGEQIGLEGKPELLPLRLFGGKALIEGHGQVYYDVQDRWVPLVSLRRSRFATEAELFVAALDGKQPDCVWHRLLIDACIPPDCEVAVATRAGNDLELLAFSAWNEEPSLHRRATGSELPWSTAEKSAGLDTWELLFQRATGQYLEIRLTLRGTGRSTPRLRALRAWYPRFSYLDHYLPAVYRENAESASFLDRFLANFEGIFTRLEDRIAAFQLLLGVQSAPAETLEWLASWFGVALDPSWDESRRRLFLRHAVDFFEWRGTVPGLRMALRLLLDECPDDSIFDLPPKHTPAIRIVEKFRTRAVPRALYSAPGETAGLPARVAQSRWDLSEGAAGLERRLAAHTGPRSTFFQETLGFVPKAPTSRDAELWRAFLEQRYPVLSALNDAWQTSYREWSEIALPDAPPRADAALRDWLHFEGIVLPAHRTAHRFTVYLPQSKLMAEETRRDLARRVIALEKPAHTSFDVQFYWGFFRVGEARLGEDTLVDAGGRSPEFLSPFVLDRNFLGSGYLAPRDRSRLASPCPRPGCPPPSTAGGSR
ncbi:MAG TPA: phage tail protein [Thermoanaerobaculia bacterium]|nr:phage tail protein [Thermoanaerobaculia bacterium]